MSGQDKDEITVLHLDEDGNVKETTKEKKVKEYSEQEEESEGENYVSKYRLTDYPEPDFIGEYRLGTDQNQYYNAVF